MPIAMSSTLTILYFILVVSILCFWLSMIELVIAFTCESLMQFGPLLMLVMYRRSPTMQDLSISRHTEAVRFLAFSSRLNPSYVANSAIFSGGSAHLVLVAGCRGYPPTTVDSMDLPKE